MLKTNPTDLVINHPDLDLLARDKWRTFELFHDFMPLTFQIDASNWKAVVERVPGDKIVLKPVFGLGGNGIIIADKATLNFDDLNINEPYIAQEFIDSSTGIPGLCEGYHDLRVIVFNGLPKLSFIRTPKAGTLLANIAQGGTAQVIEIDQVPGQMLELVKRIDSVYAKYGARVYAADFFMKNGQAYLIETNARPGMRSYNEAYTQKFYRYLFEAFSSAIDERRSAQ